MKKFILLALCLIASVAQARIGETPEQSVVRYGPLVGRGIKPFAVLPTFVVDHHSKNGFTVWVHYMSGHTDWIRFYKETGDHRFSEEEIDILLASDGGRERWSKLPRDPGESDSAQAFGRKGAVAQYHAGQVSPYLELVTDETVSLLLREFKRRREGLENLQSQQTRDKLSGF